MAAGADAVPDELRELLTADVAVAEGLAAPGEVGEALRRYWEKRGARGVSVLTELEQTARLSPEQVARLRKDVERFVAEAGGDPRAALGRRGGVSRSLHAALGGEGPAGLSRALGRLGVGLRTTLRSLPPDRYVDFRPVGVGGMGIVYWTLDTELNRPVAFKVVRPWHDAEGAAETAVLPDQVSPPPRDSEEATTFEELRARFLQEAWVTGGMEHPGVVPVYEIGQTAAGVPYYTMRFVRGSRTLAKAIQETRGRGIEERMALLEPFLKVCDAIRYAHARGIVHRDLKPENVALGEYGEAIVLDWGLAKVREKPDLTGTRWAQRLHEWRAAADLKTMASALGTPGYMAPEAARGDVEHVDEASDVYSLGAILFEVLTGRLPFEFRTFLEYAQKVMDRDPPSPREVDATVPQALSDLCARALARERTKRTPTVDALAAGLREWQAQRAIDREVETLLAEARAATAAARGLQGELLLGQLDHARSALTQVLQRRPEQPEALALQAEVRTLSDRGLSERERITRRRLLRRIAVVALAIAVVAGAGVAWLLDRGRRQAEAAADRARAAEKVAADEAERAKRERERADREATVAKEQRDLATRKTAEVQAALHHARVLALVNASAEASHGDSMLGLLLAREAVRREATPESLSRLQEAFVDTLERWLGDAGVPLVAVDFAEGPILLLGGADGKARLWRPLAPAPDVVLEGGGVPLVTAVFSSDGTLVLTTDEDGVARVFDREGKEVARSADQAKGPLRAAFAPQGHAIVTGDAEGVVRLHAEPGSEPREMRGHDDAILDVAFSPRGDRIATASRDGTARLWTAEGKQVKVLRGHEGDVLDLDWHPQGTLLATAARDGTVRLWDADGAFVAECAGHESAVNAVAFAPTGAWVATGSSDRTARVFDLEGTQRGLLVGHQGDVTSVAWASTGQALATGSFDYTTRVWTPDGRTLAVLRGHSRAVEDVLWWPRIAGLFTVSDDGTVRTWEHLGEAAGTYRGHGTQVLFAAFGPDGQTVLTTATSPEVLLWNLEGRDPRSVGAHGGFVLHAAFSPRGDRIATASADGTARLFATEDGRPLLTLRGHETTVRSVAFHPTEERYVTASDDGTARLWDAKGAPVAVLRGHVGGVNRAVFSPRGDRIATCGDDGTVRLFDGTTGARVSVLVGSGPPLDSVAYSPDGERLVLAAADHTAVVIDLAGARLRTLQGHVDRVTYATFSPKGDRIATASLDGTARLWDAEGRELLVLRGHTGSLLAASFSPDGRALVTASTDGIARRWLLDTPELLALLEERITRTLSAEETARYAELLLD